MKYIPCILLFLLLLPPLWLLLRQRIAYHKTKAMSPGQTLALLKELLSPFGYCYLPIQDAISTTNDAWQKEWPLFPELPWSISVSLTHQCRQKISSQGFHRTLPFPGEMEL